MVCDTVLFKQPGDYCVVPAPPCGRPPLRGVEPEYVVPRLTAWQPIKGFENVGVLPLPCTARTNACNRPCYAPCPMSTQPMRFPNMVTGFERNPGYGARAALNTRYTAYEWAQNNLSHLNEACTVSRFSEGQRADALCAMRQQDECTHKGQMEVKQRLGERLRDLNCWRDNANKEYCAMVCEIDCLQDKRRCVEKAVQDLEGPIHIALECLSQRESRLGIDLVHDRCEAALFDELAAHRKNQEKLRCIHSKIMRQLCNLRACQHDLERDIRAKDGAILIDCTCCNLNNCSPSLTYHGGIQQFKTTFTDNCTWCENNNNNMKRSQMERCKSEELRCEADNAISAIAQETFCLWDATNECLGQSADACEAKRKMKENLHCIQDELFRNEKYQELLRKAIDDKTNPLKLAHTRLEARSHRQDAELCDDCVHKRLLEEVADLQCAIQELHRKLMETESAHAQLLRTRGNLECALRAKANTLFIDREKCMGLRRSYPMHCFIKYC